MTDALTPRRREILEAATAVLARSGARGLTHRAVDREAGLAEGSTSAYFRSRDALQGALADFVAHRLAGEVRTMADQYAEQVDDPRHLATATARLFETWLQSPDLLRARLELTVAATRDQELASRFLAWRGDLVAVVERMLSARGAEPAPDGVRRSSAESLVAALDGVLMAALLQPSERRQSFVQESVDRLLSTFIEAR